MKNLTAQSRVEGLSDESAERILAENGFENAGLIINSIQKQFAGSGHYKLSVQIMEHGVYDDLWLDKVTTNMNLIDDWGEDEMYFEGDNTGHWFDSHDEVIEAAFEEIMRSEHNQESLRDWIES